MMVLTEVVPRYSPVPPGSRADTLPAAGRVQEHTYSLISQGRVCQVVDNEQRAQN